MSPTAERAEVAVHLGGHTYTLSRWMLPRDLQQTMHLPLSITLINAEAPLHGCTFAWRSLDRPHNVTVLARPEQALVVAELRSHDPQWPDTCFAAAQMLDVVWKQRAQRAAEGEG